MIFDRQNPIFIPAAGLPWKDGVSNYGHRYSKKSWPHFIILIISIHPWLFFTSLIYILSQLDFFTSRSPYSNQICFCQFSIWSLCSMLKFIVMNTNITFFTKLCRIIIKASHRFDIHIAYVFIFLCQFWIKHPLDFVGSRWIFFIASRWWSAIHLIYIYMSESYFLCTIDFYRYFHHNSCSCWPIFEILFLF
jgi:hypothetical protein